MLLETSSYPLPTSSLPIAMHWSRLTQTSGGTIKAPDCKWWLPGKCLPDKDCWFEHRNSMRGEALRIPGDNQASGSDTSPGSERLSYQHYK